MTEHNIKLSYLEGLDREDFDPAEYITSDEAAAAYITQALASNDAVNALFHPYISNRVLFLWFYFYTLSRFF